jgi:hypothetical protein
MNNKSERLYKIILKEVIKILENHKIDKKV